MTGPAEANGLPLRPVSSLMVAKHQLEGGGFGVFRPFPTGTFDQLDPFLLLDEMEPTDYPPGEAIGAPDHPHRGFETVTYVLDGEVEHRDSIGNVDVIGPGDVQWMTAGDGIVHSEMPSTRIQTDGGRVHGFQLWVNLPTSAKRTKPRYQALLSDRLPKVAGSGWSGVVIAGRLGDVVGPADTHTPITYLHLTLQPGSQLEVDIEADHQAGVYVFGGSAMVGPDREITPSRHLAVFDREPGALAIAAPPSSSDDERGATEVLVIAGRPLDEPVARYGPFVMNSRDELVEAIEDFQAGRMGAIAPAGAP